MQNEQVALVAQENKKYTVHWRGYEKGIQVYKTHGSYDTYDDAYQSIKDWWELNEYYPVLIRLWKDKDNTTHIDYGLHHAFYEITEDKHDD